MNVKVAAVLFATLLGGNAARLAAITIPSPNG